MSDEVVLRFNRNGHAIEVTKHFFRVWSGNWTGTHYDNRPAGLATILVTAWVPSHGKLCYQMGAEGNARLIAGDASVLLTGQEMSTVLRVLGPITALDSEFREIS